MLGGADNPNGELLSYIIGADRQGVLKGKHVSPASCTGGQHHFFYVVTWYAFRL